MREIEIVILMSDENHQDDILNVIESVKEYVFEQDFEVISEENFWDIDLDNYDSENVTAVAPNALYYLINVRAKVEFIDEIKSAFAEDHRVRSVLGVLLR
jgi:ribosomal protein S6